MPFSCRIGGANRLSEGRCDNVGDHGDGPAGPQDPRGQFFHVLQDEFNLSYREAREVVSAVQGILGLDRPTGQVRPGQIRLVVVSLRVPFGPPLRDTDRVEVTLTVDAGAEDAEVLAQQGRLA